MVYARKRKSYGGRKGKRTMRKRVYRKSSALTVAKKALSLAKKTMMSSTETKYLSQGVQSDLSGTAPGFLGSSLVYYLNRPGGGFNPLFNTDSVTGNKSFLKYVKGIWEIHMDNVQNEEETCNFTIAVVQPRTDFDGLQTASDVVSNNNGQIFFNPRLVKVHYYKHFTLTMGGTSPGSAGESRRYGKFYIPVNKMIRFVSQGLTGQNASFPASTQDQLYLLFYTDNSSTDLESPRLNAHLLQCWRDTDQNH